jgi:hypothetical protein
MVSGSAMARSVQLWNATMMNFTAWQIIAVYQRVLNAITCLTAPMAQMKITAVSNIVLVYCTLSERCQNK